MNSPAVSTELTERIRAAFHELPLLRPEEIVARGPELHLQKDRVRELFGTLHWASVPEGLVTGEQGALLSMTPAGVQRFLPAYLLFDLSRGGSSLATDAVLFYFLPVADARERLAAIYEQLSSDQLTVVRDYFVLMRDRYSEDFEKKDYDAVVASLESALRAKASAAR